MNDVKLYSSFESKSAVQFVRNVVRNIVIHAFSLQKNIDSSDDWIRFPYYHHVFDDEKKGFKRQLKYLKNFGDFISMDDACELLKSPSNIAGRYFCLGMDDGFENCATNMADVTSELNIPVIIFLPVNFIGFSPDIENIEQLNVFNVRNNPPVKFLSWEQCKNLLALDVTFGSHTMSHTALNGLSEADLRFELSESKKIIEKNLNISCNHFACPWGRPEIDFETRTISDLMSKYGYISFSTTERGKMDNHSQNLFHVKRDHVLANWPNYQLKYFFSD